MKTSLLLTPILVTVTVLTAPTTLDSGVSLEQLASDPALLKSTFSSNVVTAAAAAAGYDTTSNQLTDGTPCRATTVIYARGTTQDGNIGAAGDVGPDLFNNLSSIIGASKLAVQGVDYPATIAGYLAQLAGDNGTGGQTMADLVTRANSQCPSTKVVLSGYSQGGQVVHDAADILKSNTTAVNSVAAVVIFGDPNSHDPVGNIPTAKVDIICHDGDNICDAGIIVLPQHLNYQKDAPAAAQFIASKVT